MKCCYTDWNNLVIFLFNEQEGDFALAKSNPCDNNGGVAGVSPAERVARNEVRAQGETSPSFMKLFFIGVI